MKVIQLKDYSFVGTQKSWYLFQNKHYQGNDAEIIMVKQAKVFHEDGSYIYLDPVTDSSNKTLQRLNAYYSILNKCKANVVEGE